MASARFANYEAALVAAFEPLGEKRFTRRVFAHAAGEGVWHGIWISLNFRHGRMVAQPNLAMFCLEASKFINEGLAQVYGRKPYHGPSRRLGSPVLSWPLYDQVRKKRGEDRMPFSYDVHGEDEIGKSVSMMVDDYFSVGWKYFESTDTLKALEERLRNDPMPGSGMYALAVRYLMNGRIDSAEIAESVRRSPNEMTTKFVEWFGSAYGASSAGPA